MSQSGPYPGPAQQPPGRGPDGPYTEPADPWGSQDAWPTGPATTPPPSSPTGFGSPGYDPSFGFDRSQPGWGFQPPAPPPPRRRGPGAGIIVLVVVLGLLALAGGGVTWWLLSRPDTPAQALPQPSPTTAAPSTAASGDADARFVTSGQCVRNEGSEDVPQMTIAPCAKGTFEVLKRVDGATTGERDAEKKCASVAGYTNWYFYDSELDALDFVLCLRGR
jgi:hypothetical protein